MFLSSKEIAENSNQEYWVEGIYVKKYHPLGCFITHKPLTINNNPIMVVMPSLKLRETLKKANEGNCSIRLANSDHINNGFEKQEIFFDSIKFEK